MTDTNPRRIDYGKPWTCECGASHKIGAYAAAHAKDLLEHTCEHCKRVHCLQNGLLWLDKDIPRRRGKA